MLNATEIICFSFDGGETYALRWCYNCTHRHPHGSAATHYEFVLFLLSVQVDLICVETTAVANIFSIRARTGRKIEGAFDNISAAVRDNTVSGG